MKLQSLQAIDKFLIWRYESQPGKEKPTKVPYSPIDCCQVGTDEKYRHRLTAYADALKAAAEGKPITDIEPERGFDGVGFVFVRFNDNLHICGIDIDGHNPDSDFVQGITAMFSNAYIELSPSGNGIHIIMLVDISRIQTESVKENGKDRIKLHSRYYQKNRGNGCECYISGLTNRYFTHTGKTIQDGQDVNQTDELLNFLDLYMLRDSAGTESKTDNGTSVLTDDEIIEKARAAANADRFIALFYENDLTAYNNDESSADMALLSMLAFWTRKDPAQMERLFNQSALGQRDKWKGREDYRRQSINRAIKNCREVYKPPKKCKPIMAYFTGLSRAYMNEHEYIVGVQKLVTGGYGNDTVYEYLGGVWKPQSATDIKSSLTMIAMSANIVPDPKEVDKAYRHILMSGTRKDVDKFNNNENLVCFQNGVYRLSDGAKLEHSPDYYFTIQLNANIPEKIEPTPYCDICIDNIGGADERELLLQIYGAAISNVNCSRFKKALLLFGVGDAGKTQLKTHCERVLGQDNYNNVDLSEVENNRFLKAAFQNKRLGGSNDLSNQTIRELKIFKQLTGGDSIEADNKNEKGFRYHYKGILWFLSNNFPKFGGDKGEHVYKRWILIKCKNAVPDEKQIKDLCDRMFEERDSLCILALQALQRAVRNNYAFSIPESSKQTNDDYKRENSVVRMFLEECTTSFDIKAITCKEIAKSQSAVKVWESFRGWRIYNKEYQGESRRAFENELAIIFDTDVRNIKDSKRWGKNENEVGRFYPVMLNDEGFMYSAGGERDYDETPIF